MKINVLLKRRALRFAAKSFPHLLTRNTAINLSALRTPRASPVPKGLQTEQSPLPGELLLVASGGVGLEELEAT